MWKGFIGSFVGIYEKERFPQRMDHMGKGYYYSCVPRFGGWAPVGGWIHLKRRVRLGYPLAP